MNLKENFAFIFKNAGKEVKKIYLAVIFSVLSNIFELIPYVLIYKIIMLVREGTSSETLLGTIYLSAFIIFLYCIFVGVSGVLSHSAAFSVLYEIRKRTFAHFANLNMGFFSNKTQGELKKALDEDVEKLELFLAHQIPDTVSSVTTPLFTIGFLATLNWKLALVMLIPLFLSLLMQALMFIGYKERLEEYNKLTKTMSSTIIEYINGIALFKAFNLTARTFDRYKNVVQKYNDFYVALFGKYSHLVAFQYLFLDSGLLITIPLGGALYLSGKLTFSSFVLFLLLSSVFLSSFRKLMQLGGNLAMLLRGAENIKAIMDSPAQKSGELKLSKGKASIEFNQVSFKYEDKYVLKDFNLKIEPNMTLALVGPSGSGKTTAGLLVGRFWDIDEGQILINGVDVKDYDLDSLMQNTAFVFQDVFMLSDSLYENIRMGLDVSKEEVVEAAKKARIHEFILACEDGYDTVVGENTGIKLSGGEKQRISIARAILKNTPIIILDEITSYSDIENEEQIQEALKNLLEDKTAIIIAHRLYTIKDVDKIVVMEEGEIEEEGTHKELISLGKLYEKMWSIGGGGNV